MSRETPDRSSRSTNAEPVLRTGARLVVSLGIALLLIASAPYAQQPSNSLDATQLRAAISTALQSAPRGFEALQAPAQTGVQVLEVDITQLSARRQQITVNLSQRALTYDPSGEVEPILDQVLAATARLTALAGDIDYRFLIEGLPLEQFLPRILSPAARPQAIPRDSRVVVSAGHGWYWNELTSTWRLQRDYYGGIVEDLVNWDIANFLSDELTAAGFDARPARQPDRSAPSGNSGYPGWEESAKYFIQALGAPPAVWGLGISEYNRDINSRPLYANWLDSAVMISIHNNGGGGTGTETWYDAANGWEAESRRLAQIINTKVVAAIRAEYNPAWPDRGLRTCNGCKGENRLAAGPAVLLELAFMDMPSPDNAALHDDRFKQLAARAIREALEEWAAQ